MKIKKGFTLIELLVVIAIIGLLSSIVLASLKTARDKAADAAIQQTLAGLKNQAAVFLDTYGSYGDATGAAYDCESAIESGRMYGDDPAIQAQITSAFSAAGADIADGVCFTSVGSAPSWVVAVPRKSNPNTYWCVDSSGNSMCLSGNSCDEESTVFTLPTDGVTPGSCLNSEF